MSRWDRGGPGLRSGMILVQKHASLLAKLGLATVEQVKAFRGEVVTDHHGRRDVCRIKAAGPDGRELVLFLKRNWKPYRKDGLASLLRHGRVWSIARQEWENSKRLEAAGLKVAGLVACGDACGFLWERFSFLVTEAATGSQTLDQFLRGCRDHALRQRVFDALARTLRQMHAAGLASPDLFARHVFVDLGVDPPGFCFIDMARLDRRLRISATLRARDLAALNLTAPLRFVSAQERVRFLRVYAGSADRRLVARIRRRVIRLSRTRRKFRDFVGGGGGAESLPAEAAHGDSVGERFCLGIPAPSHGTHQPSEPDS